MNQIKGVIFDWAGTTIDYGSVAPLKGFIDGFKHIGYDITNEMARKPMGLLKIDHTRAIADMLEDELTEEQIQTAYSVFEETLFANIASHCEIKDHVLDAVAEMRRRGIKIGSTTGYTSEMMETVAPKVAAQGYSPDYYVTPDMVSKGRPYPYMVWKNMTELDIDNPRHLVKIGDTLSDIGEGLNVGCWTVGVIMGSSELGLTREEVEALDPTELAIRKQAVHERYYQAGADYIIDDIDQLIGVIDDINRKLAQNTAYKLLTPGPLSTRASVKQAMMVDHCTWDDEYQGITTSILNDITAISANDDYATVLLQGSGSYAVEAMVNGLIYSNKKLLILSNGAYGERIVTMAQIAGHKYTVLRFANTQPVDMEQVEAVLKEEGGDIEALVFVHCETTVGIINPVEALTKLAKDLGKTVLVDAMSSFGAYDIDMAGWGIDALAASANKCLEGAPGISFVIATKQILKDAKDVSTVHSLDLYDQYKGLYQGGGKFRFTSPTNIVLGLRQAIDNYHLEGGLTARAIRYQRNQQVLVSGLAKLGIKAVIETAHQSHIITAFHLEELDFNQLYQGLKAEGFIIYPGKLTSIPTFRLGNIGDVYPSDMERLVDIVKTLV